MINKPKWSDETTRIVNKIPQQGIFLTGIEGSDMVVNGKRRNLYREAGDFYNTYPERLKRIRELGITNLRFGLPYSEVHLAKDIYDFSLSDNVLPLCEKLGIEIYFDFLHFGLPDWLHEGKEEKYFQNSEFPFHFAKYVETIVRRYPKLKYFTPVNEPTVAATCSAKFGSYTLWNESISNDKYYIKALKNLAKAAILAEQTIRKVWRDEKRKDEPLFFQNDSIEEAIAMPESGRDEEARIFNLQRYLALDFILGHYTPDVLEYLLAMGESEEEYEWFMKYGSKKGKILGIDYYQWNIHMYYKDKQVNYDNSMPYELSRLMKIYWQRYKIPMMHTEVNALPKDGATICQQTYDTIEIFRKEAGIPVLGMGWYGDESQTDWHTHFKTMGEEYPVGLFRNGRLQPVGKLFSKLLHKGFSPILNVK